MMNTWLIRRSVRMPEVLSTTASSSSSVCRLPFISAVASPLRTRATEAAALAWLCGVSTIRTPARSIPAAAATRRMRCSGPTSSGTISFAAAAAIAPPSEGASHGCAIAVGAAGRLSQWAISRSYDWRVIEDASMSGLRRRRWAEYTARHGEPPRFPLQAAARSRQPLSRAAVDPEQ